MKIVDGEWTNGKVTLTVNGDYPMTASKLIAPLRWLRGIIHDMANMKDMRDLVSLVKKLNDDNVKEHSKQKKPDILDEVGHILSDSEYKDGLIRKQGAIDEYIIKYRVSEQKARDIYGDATSSKYAYLLEPKIDTYIMGLGNVKKVDVSSAGRGLIKRRFDNRVPTGLWRETIEKLWPITSAVTTIILCVAAVINVVIAYYIYRHK